MEKINKSRKNTALITLFLGWIWAHHFYLWNYILGFIYLFFCWTYIPFIISIIESIRFFSMTNEEFHKRNLKQEKHKSFKLSNSTQVKPKDSQKEQHSSVTLSSSKKVEPESNQKLEWIDINISSSYDNVYSYYWEFTWSNWERFNTQEEKTTNYPESFWDGVHKAYKEITIKLEWVKQYGDVEWMKQFEQDIHTFFLDRVLKSALEQDLIDKVEADKEKPRFDRQINDYYKFFWRVLSESEMREAKRLFRLEQEFYKKSTKRQIYDLYCKSLRRVWNFYKKYNEWELALNTFLKIKEFWFEGIMDGKSIIKCQKEIDILNQKLLKK